VTKKLLSVDERSEGWGFLSNAKRAHYLRDGRSLCRKWLVLSAPEWVRTQERAAAPGPDDCKACWKKAPENAP